MGEETSGESGEKSSKGTCFTALAKRVASMFTSNGTSTETRGGEASNAPSREGYTNLDESEAEEEHCNEAPRTRTLEEKIEQDSYDPSSSAWILRVKYESFYKARKLEKIEEQKLMTMYEVVRLACIASGFPGESRNILKRLSTELWTKKDASKLFEKFWRLKRDLDNLFFYHYYLKNKLRHYGCIRSEHFKEYIEKNNDLEKRIDCFLSDPRHECVDKGFLDKQKAGLVRVKYNLITYNDFLINITPMNHKQLMKELKRAFDPLHKSIRDLPATWWNYNQHLSSSGSEKGVKRGAKLVKQSAVELVEEENNEGNMEGDLINFDPGDTMNRPGTPAHDLLE